VVFCPLLRSVQFLYDRSSRLDHIAGSKPDLSQLGEFLLVGLGTPQYSLESWRKCLGRGKSGRLCLYKKMDRWMDGHIFVY